MKIVIILLVIHFVLGIIAQVIIFQNGLLSNKIRFINSLFIWLIPFFWSLLIFVNRKPRKLNIATKENNKGRGSEHRDNWVHLTGGGS